jgi:hypothetical protein
MRPHTYLYHWTIPISSSGWKSGIGSHPTKAWEDLRQDQTIQHLADMVSRRLVNIPNCPSRDAIQFLCSYNNAQREGNSIAHTATLAEIRDAVMTKPLDTGEDALGTGSLSMKMFDVM